MAKVTFPKIGQKHHLTPLFGACDDIPTDIKIPKRVVFVYSWQLQQEINAILPLTKFDGNIGGGGVWRPTNYISKDRKLLVVCLPLGGPLTAIAAEQAVALGCKEVLILGTAGGIASSLSIADIVICNRAIRDEGTSHHYIPNSKYVMPSNTLTQKLMDRITIPYQVGMTWTTDAAFAETTHEINCYRKQGVKTVEMEAATLFAVAKKRGIHAAAIFTISDILGVKWSGFRPEVLTGKQNLAKIAKQFRNI